MVNNNLDEVIFKEKTKIPLSPEEKTRIIKDRIENLSQRPEVTQDDFRNVNTLYKRLYREERKLIRNERLIKSLGASYRSAVRFNKSLDKYREVTYLAPYFNVFAKKFDEPIRNADVLLINYNGKLNKFDIQKIGTDPIKQAIDLIEARFNMKYDKYLEDLVNPDLDDSYEKPTIVHIYAIKQSNYNVNESNTINCFIKLLNLPEEQQQLLQKKYVIDNNLKFDLIQTIAKETKQKLIIKDALKNNLLVVNRNLKGKSKIIIVHNQHALKPKKLVSTFYKTQKELDHFIKNTDQPCFYINDFTFMVNDTLHTCNDTLQFNNPIKKLTPCNYDPIIYDYIKRSHHYLTPTIIDHDYQGLAYQYDIVRAFSTCHNMPEYDGYPTKPNQFYQTNNVKVINFPGFTEIDNIVLPKKYNYLSTYFQNNKVYPNILLKFLLNNQAEFTVKSTLFSFNKTKINFDNTGDKFLDNMIIGKLTPNSYYDTRLVIKDIKEFNLYLARYNDLRLSSTDKYLLLDININKKQERPQFTHVKSYILAYTMIKLMKMVSEVTNNNTENLVKINIDAIFVKKQNTNSSTFYIEKEPKYFEKTEEEILNPSRYDNFRNHSDKTPDNLPIYKPKSRTILYHGLAGTGKSYSALKQVDQMSDVLIVTPTHNLKSKIESKHDIKTYHDVFNIQIDNTSNIKLKYHQYKTFLLDEVGMLNNDILTAIMQTLKHSYVIATYGEKQMDGFMGGDQLSLTQAKKHFKQHVHMLEPKRTSLADHNVRLKIIETQDISHVKTVSLQTLLDKLTNQIQLPLILCNRVKTRIHYNYVILKYLRQKNIIKPTSLIPVKIHNSEIKHIQLQELTQKHNLAFVQTIVSNQGITSNGDFYYIEDEPYHKNAIGVAFTRNKKNDLQYKIKDETPYYDLTNDGYQALYWRSINVLRTRLSSNKIKLI